MLIAGTPGLAFRRCSRTTPAEKWSRKMPSANALKQRECVTVAPPDPGAQRASALRAYFDTSALITLVLVEDGFDVAAELWHGYPAAWGVLA
jgi:hypothetical protein